MSVSVEPAQFNVAHLDADAFYVSIELRRHPELRGMPVVVAGSGPRAVVTTASYEARKYGVGSAMPASRARRLCPQAVVLPPDFTTYREASREVMEIVRAHVERVEVVGLDEAYLDLVGLFSPRSAMRRLITEIKTATELTCSVGIGPNKLVAKVASDADKPAGFVVLTREQACTRFAGAPPGLVPGIGPKTAARLAGLGLTTLAAVGAAPEHMLTERFGPNLGIELDAVRVSNTTARSEPSARSYPSRVSGPSTRTSAIRHACAKSCNGCAASCARACSRTGAVAARSGSRSASTTSRPSPAPIRWPSPPATESW